MWNSANKEDVSEIVELRKTLSTYYYTLSEYKAEQEAKFLTWETERKNVFNHCKLNYIDAGKSSTEATTRAEVEVKSLRESEVKHEREFKQARDILNSLSEVLNAMSSAINVAMAERKQGGYHT